MADSMMALVGLGLNRGEMVDARDQIVASLRDLADRVASVDLAPEGVGADAHARAAAQVTTMILNALPNMRLSMLATSASTADVMASMAVMADAVEDAVTGGGAL